MRRDFDNPGMSRARPNRSTTAVSGAISRPALGASHWMAAAGLLRRSGFLRILAFFHEYSIFLAF